MPSQTSLIDHAAQTGLFPLSPEMLRRLFAEHDARLGQRETPDTPEQDNA